MSNNLEIEKTYLAKYIPFEISKSKSSKLIDVYIPALLENPTIRLRKKDDAFELTKKVQLNSNDASTHQEYSVPITKEEFEALRVGAKFVEKTRYYFKYGGFDCELDLFEGNLIGLVLVDFEFKDQFEYNSFEMPEFCLADVTQEDFISGKSLAGKNYSEIEKDLEKFGYKRLF